MNNSKLLFVDDEPTNLLLYMQMLKEYDFQISTAANGVECLEQVDSQLPDLILMDWNMPVMDGIETLKLLKNKELTQNIPVLMITGVMTSSKDLAYALSIGAIDFLKKPFDGIELCARVKNILLLSETLNKMSEQFQVVENKNIFITSLLESIPHPVIYCSLDGILQMCNEFYEQILGIHKNELLGQSVYKHFLDEHVDFHKQKDADLVENRVALFYETKMRHGNKTFIISKNLVFNNQDNPTGILTVFIDISDLKKANDQLVNRKKIELISSTLRLMQVNKLNISLIGDFEKLLPYTNTIGQGMIQQIRNKYELNIREQNWNDFDKKIENAYDSFYTVLLEKYPNLTPNERKLCAFLRSGLSTKEIAILTFQNPQSIDVARYRIRKKLNLKNDDNLIDFLLLAET